MIELYTRLWVLCADCTRTYYFALMIPVIFQKRLADSIPTPEVTYHPAIVPSCCKDIKEMKDVCLECLEFLMEHHQPTCKLIRAGRVQRQRHDDFKKSKKSRKALDFQCYSLRFFFRRSTRLCDEMVKERVLQNWWH